MGSDLERLSFEGGEIPRIGLGTWQLKGQTCVNAVEYALNSGYRHIDTAQIYGNEEQVGKGIQASNIGRDEFWLTTKLWRDNLEKDGLKASMRESLRKLGTDYVDLLLIHWPFPELDLEEAIPVMEELVEEGLTRFIGVSNFTPRQYRRAQEIASEKILTNQVEYHPFLSQEDNLEAVRGNEAFLTAYSPLARGDVIGNEKLMEIGDRYGKTPVQVALRWHLQQEDVVAVPKASSREHIDQNLDVFDFELSQREMETVSGLAENDRKVDPSFAPW